MKSESMKKSARYLIPMTVISQDICVNFTLQVLPEQIKHASCSADICVSSALLVPILKMIKNFNHIASFEILLGDV